MSVAICVECDRKRTADDFDYSPMQVAFGKRLGWYSASDDGEICGACMERIMKL